jgi:hypothetical protein
MRFVRVFFCMGIQARKPLAGLHRRLMWSARACSRFRG